MARGRILVACFFVFAVALWAPAADSTRVTVVPTADGFALWLPGNALTQDQVTALGVSHRFVRTWEGFFGSQPALPDPLVIAPSKDLRDSVFRALWDHAAELLEPADRPAAFAAFKSLLLDDSTEVRSDVVRTVQSGRIETLPWNGPLLYLFLKENVSDASFVHDVLPPDPDAARLKAALSTRGLPWELFRNRFVAWIYGRAIESRIIAPPPGNLPAVWMPEGDLAPGDVSMWRFPLEDPEEGVEADVGGEPERGLLVMSYYTDEAGRPVQAGLSELKPGRMVFPRKGRTLWLLLWNTASRQTGAGLTLTLWKSMQPAFTLRQASLKGPLCEILIDEGPGIAEYELEPQGPEGRRLAPPFEFASEGEGRHNYHLRLSAPFPNATSLQVSCRTASGGFFATSLPLTEPPSP